MNQPQPFQYKPLESSRHIRLLELCPNFFRDDDLQEQLGTVGSGRLSVAAIKHCSLDRAPAFETISYTWGGDVRIGKLHVVLGNSHIGLTQSLVGALPHLFSKSTTGFLWIDQLCINQEDLEERAEQISLMGDIFRSATATMIWLGPEDDHTAKVRAWIDGFKNFGIHDNEEPRGGYGQLKKFIADPRLEFSNNIYHDAICAMLDRPWFSRAWIVQEYLLSTSVSFICGSEVFTEQNLQDIGSAVFTEKNLVDISTPGKWTNFNRLDELRENLFIENKSLEHIDMMRLLCETCGHFETTEPIDKLFSLLGLWKPAKFTPSYTAKHVEVFTDFTRCIADETGCLEFLSLARNSQSLSSNADGLPSWVPAWTDTSKQWPDSIALAGVLSYKKVWDASQGRKYLPPKSTNDVVRGKEQLLVRGRIVDLVDQVFDKDSSISPSTGKELVIPYLERFLSELSLALPPLSHWTVLDLLREISNYSTADFMPQETPEEILESLKEGAEFLYINILNERRVILTENGDVGFAPPWCCKGNRIAILHGCSVPMLIEKCEDGSFNILGDCFIYNIMLGQAVYWEESEAFDFVLN